jgi:hypothetical protein
MLQSEAGYIDARPPPPIRRNLLATRGRTIHRVRRDIWRGAARSKRRTKSIPSAKYAAVLELAISRGWLALHESGPLVKLTQAVRTCSPDAVRVPELTSATDIKLNKRVSLRPIQTSLAWLQSRRLAPQV